MFEVSGSEIVLKRRELGLHGSGVLHVLFSHDAQRLVEWRVRHRMGSDTVAGKTLMLTRGGSD